MPDHAKVPTLFVSTHALAWWSHWCWLRCLWFEFWRACFSPCSQWFFISALGTPDRTDWNRLTFHPVWEGYFVLFVFLLSAVFSCFAVLLRRFWCCAAWPSQQSAPWGTPPVWWIVYSFAACHHSIGLQPINCLHNVPANPQTEWFGQAGGLRPKTRTGGTAAAVPLLRMNLRAIEVP